MKKILIIDDEEGICWALEKVLRQEGYEIYTATNGYDGLDIFNSREIDLVLLDIKMKETNGLEVLQQIRQNNQTTPVIIMTGYSSMDIALEAINKGASGYLTKPVKNIHLKEAVRELLQDNNNENEPEANWSNHK